MQHLGSSRVGPSPNVPEPLRFEYIKLLCELQPDDLVKELQHLPPDFLDRKQAARICEEQGVYDAVVWCINDGGDPRGALQKASQFIEQLSERLAHALQSEHPSDDNDKLLSSVRTLQTRAVAICVQESKPASDDHVEVEENWFQLLRSEITAVYRVSLFCSSQANLPDSADDARLQAERTVLDELRSSVHETFNSLLSVSSNKAVSFPRLFKRLVDVKDARISKGAQYTEFRAILGGMLESYRSEGDMLVITKHLMSRDLFDSVDALAKARSRGWAPSHGVCSTCGTRLHDKGKKPMIASVDGEAATDDSAIIVSRTGAVYHRKCLPIQDTTNGPQ